MKWALVLDMLHGRFVQGIVITQMIDGQALCIILCCKFTKLYFFQILSIVSKI